MLNLSRILPTLFASCTTPRICTHSPVYALPWYWRPTGIFSLMMHDLMLRSLPVADRPRYIALAREQCCVPRGSRDECGSIPHPLFKRLRSAAPEFEEVRGVRLPPGSTSYSGTMRRWPSPLAASLSPATSSPFQYSSIPGAAGHQNSITRNPSALVRRRWPRTF
jgi:hypothetical protein